MCSCDTFITPEKLGTFVFEAFQKNDVEMALDFILYSADYEAVFSQADDLSAEEKEKLIAKYNDPTRIEELVNRFKDRFDEIIKEGISLGIVWEQAQFEYIKEPSPNAEHIIQAGEIYIVFSYEEKLYEIRLDDCIKTPRGWLMSDEPSFQGIVNE